MPETHVQTFIFTHLKLPLKIQFTLPILRLNMPTLAKRHSMAPTQTQANAYLLRWMVNFIENMWQFTISHCINLIQTHKRSKKKPKIMTEEWSRKWKTYFNTVCPER